MAERLSDEQIRLLRARAQRLNPTQDAPAPAQVLEEIGGVQAQEHPAALLSVHARADYLTLAAIEQARNEQRSIIRTWAMRGTLHLVATADARWLIPLYGPNAIAADQRRFTQLGWDASRAKLALTLLRDGLSGDAALTRAEIITLLKGAGLPSTGQAPVHLIFRAAMEGLLCQGPDRGKQATYVSFERWVGPLQPLPREEALARLARRYLAAYAPANLADFTAWAGLKTSDARPGWQAVEAETAPFETSQGTLWMLRTQTAWLDEITGVPPVIRLLPRFDVYILGYAKRDLLYDAAFARRINAGGGIIHPTLMVNGSILGTWSMRPRREAVEIMVEPFEQLPGPIIENLGVEVARIANFLGTSGSLKVL